MYPWCSTSCMFRNPQNSFQLEGLSSPWNSALRAIPVELCARARRDQAGAILGRYVDAHAAEGRSSTFMHDRCTLDPVAARYRCESGI